ncbi:MAG TPA: glycoside hydrolase family 140 protein [Cyclobacteriaceae bacterium]|nr:glycoside hydrolase family 140 protein [Cyclobacteriaceae bacterium]
MRNIFTTAVLILLAADAFAQIRVSDNGRYLQTQDGKPFFWLGDTDWELFHRLTREEIETLINTRHEQGFNVLQAVALAEENGIREPNRYGDWPLNNEDPAQLLVTPGNDPESEYEYDYWDHVDFAIQKAAEKNIYIGLLPTWGDKVAHLWGEGPIIFNEANAEAYGKALATRYKDQWNVIWILGGDRPAVYKSTRDGVEKDYDDRPIWRAMARGIESVLGADAFITYHPQGGSGNRSSLALHTDAWLDMNALQSSHGSRETDPWNWITEDLAKSPQKPTLDMEPCYEDHPVNPWDGKWTREGRGYFNAYDVRARIYRGVFAGGCGVTYGHHHIWQFMNEKLYKPVNVGDTIIPWQKASKAEAAGQMQHLKNLMLSRPYFSRVGGQSLVKSRFAQNNDEYIAATRDENGGYAMIYLPQNKPVRVNLGAITGDTKNVWWYSPRDGKATSGGRVKGKGTKTFTPPKDGKDWVLVIDDATKGYRSPSEVDSSSEP